MTHPGTRRGHFRWTWIRAAKAVFDHERLTVYQRALEFLVLGSGVASGLPRGNRHLADQLHRAALSIPLNIAEGAGEFSSKEKARFYRMAKRSATECAATLDACACLRLVDEPTLRKGRDLLHQIVSMLIRMIRNLAQERTEQR